MPLLVWSYPRGAAIEAKGGLDSFYAVDYAARTASELGADLVKVNFPQPDKQSGVLEAYRREISAQDAIDAVVRSANRTLLLVSGGEHAGDEAMLEKARQSMEAGATGLIWTRTKVASWARGDVGPLAPGLQPPWNGPVAPTKGPSSHVRRRPAMGSSGPLPGPPDQLRRPAKPC